MAAFKRSATGLNGYCKPCSAVTKSCSSFTNPALDFTEPADASARNLDRSPSKCLFECPPRVSDQASELNLPKITTSPFLRGHAPPLACRNFPLCGRSRKQLFDTRSSSAGKQRIGFFVLCFLLAKSRCWRSLSAPLMRKSVCADSVPQRTSLFLLCPSS